MQTRQDGLCTLYAKSLDSWEFAAQHVFNVRVEAATVAACTSSLRPQTLVAEGIARLQRES
jgi:hypothetical protein